MSFLDILLLILLPMFEGLAIYGWTVRNWTIGYTVLAIADTVYLYKLFENLSVTTTGLSFIYYITMTYSVAASLTLMVSFIAIGLIERHTAKNNVTISAH